MELLKQLLSYGYVHSTDNSSTLHALTKHLPTIKGAQVDGKSIYSIDNKNKVALLAMIKRKKSKIISYIDGFVHLDSLLHYILSSNIANIHFE